MFTPKVSILIPTYNRAKFLKEAIESVLLQDFQDFELIIVDNFSSDDTELIVSEFVDKRIKYFKNDINTGAVNNYNKALRIASGKYIYFFSDDDVMMKGNINAKVDLLDKKEEVVLVHSSTKTINQEGEVINELHWADKTFNDLNIPRNNVQLGEDVFNILYNEWNYIAMPTVMVRQNVLKNLNLEFNNQLRYLIDWDLWLKLSRVGNFYFIDEPYVLIRKHESNETSLVQYKNYFDELIISKFSIQFTFKHILKVHEEDPITIINSVNFQIYKAFNVRIIPLHKIEKSSFSKRFKGAVKKILYNI